MMTITELAKLTGVSTRTLRYYDEINLLKPAKMNEVGYRLYSQMEVDLLQQILFYRELGMKLELIKEIVMSEHFDYKKALNIHREELLKRQKQLDQLIATVDQTIQSLEGGIQMSNKDKFEGFKQQKLKENEEKYGDEIRREYGEETIQIANEKFRGLTEEQYKAAQGLEQQLFERLKEAMEEGNPASDVAQETAELHKRWLCFYWPKYTKETHAGLAEMYVEDGRLTEYYDERVSPGATQFLHDAIFYYTKM